MPENLFDDMPDEQGAPEEEQVEGTQEGADEGAGAPDKAKHEEELRQLTRATRIEERKIAKVKADLAQKRAERKKLERSLTTDEPVEPTEKDEEEETSSVAAQPDVKETVANALKERDEQARRQKLVSEVRKIAKTRQEAERILNEALQLPPSGISEEVDIEMAADRVRLLRERSRGFVSPGVGGSGGAFSDLETRSNEEIEGFPADRLQRLSKNFGVTKEEVKRFKDGPNLGRVWGEDKIRVNNVNDQE